jgi:ElaB/YqjD/DUF883 family membrane-anchored ribosome-binding protein
MQEVARGGRSNVLFMPSNPGGLGEMMGEIRNTLFSAQANERGTAMADDWEEQSAQEASRRAARARQQAQQQAQEAQQQVERSRQQSSQQQGQPRDLAQRAQQWVQDQQQRGIPPQPPHQP